MPEGEGDWKPTAGLYLSLHEPRRTLDARLLQSGRRSAEKKHGPAAGDPGVRVVLRASHVSPPAQTFETKPSYTEFFSEKEVGSHMKMIGIFICCQIGYCCPPMHTSAGGLP